MPPLSSLDVFHCETGAAELGWGGHVKPKIIMADGVFDLLHYGHLLHLQAAKAMGDVLWVSVTDDLNVRKGVGHPVYRQEHRAALIKELRCVDHVITTSDLREGLEFVKPDILVKGQDYKHGLDEAHKTYCRNMGIQIRFTDTPKFSALDMIREHQRTTGG